MDVGYIQGQVEPFQKNEGKEVSTRKNSRKDFLPIPRNGKDRLQVCKAMF